MKVLVTGAAGFIGSVVTEELINAGFSVIAFDNLKYGHRKAVHPDGLFIEGDLMDKELLVKIMSDEKPDAVAHLAAEAFIDDSIRDPGMFYRTNVVGSCNLLDAMVETGVKRIVFSSTAAVYGQPEEMPIREDAGFAPCNSYGETKLVFERMLPWYQGAHDIRYICLRYFNACGASEANGEFRKRETHLIPICFEAALGHRAALNLFGTDYPTPDGTCIRDYIHVKDIALAHKLSLENIDTVRAAAYNLGHGYGYSNRQVIAAVERVTGLPIKVVDSDRRPGDPASLVASSEKIQSELGWRPQYTELDTIVRTAWDWRCAHPKGYAEEVSA